MPITSGIEIAEGCPGLVNSVTVMPHRTESVGWTLNPDSRSTIEVAGVRVLGELGWTQLHYTHTQWAYSAVGRYLLDLLLNSRTSTW